MRVRGLLLAVLLTLWAAPAFSQGCAMCARTAKATSTEGQRAIGRGVVLLLVPPLGFMTVGVWMACRYAKKRDTEKTASGEIQELEGLWRI